MKKQELHSLVQECIAEVLDEKYSEFQRVDKGSKDVDAKDKGEEDVYGAGYAAGEKAAKAKYKKLAEAYKSLKETTLEEAEGVTADAVAVEKAIKDKKIDPAQVKAAAEKAMKGDSTELALLMVNAGAF
jgi:hypothetical protein